MNSSKFTHKNSEQEKTERDLCQIYHSCIRCQSRYKCNCKVEATDCWRQVTLQYGRWADLFLAASSRGLWDVLTVNYNKVTVHCWSVSQSHHKTCRPYMLCQRLS